MNISLLLILVVASQFFCSDLRAATSKQSKTFVPKILQVGQDSIQVQTGRNAGMRVDGEAGANLATYKITPFTDIEVNGLKGTIADLQVGMDVRVGMGMDKDEAETIVARSEGPAAASASPSPGKKGASTTKVPGAMTFMKPFGKITHDSVMAVSSDRITIAPTGGRAVAYLITPSTEVRVNGAPAKIGQVSVGMNVTVAASGESTAGVIDATDAPDPAKTK